MNRENIMMIATAVCVVGLLFLFKELNKTREEMTGFKNFSENLVQQLNEPEQMEEEEQPLEKIEENVKE
jgi:choline kinase